MKRLFTLIFLFSISFPTFGQPAWDWTQSGIVEQTGAIRSPGVSVFDGIYAVGDIQSPSCTIRAAALQIVNASMTAANVVGNATVTGSIGFGGALGGSTISRGSDSLVLSNLLTVNGSQGGFRVNDRAGGASQYDYSLYASNQSFYLYSYKDSKNLIDVRESGNTLNIIDFAGASASIYGTTASFALYIDRTEGSPDDALSEIMKMKVVGDEIDHSSLGVTKISLPVDVTIGSVLTDWKTGDSVVWSPPATVEEIKFLPSSVEITDVTETVLVDGRRMSKTLSLLVRGVQQLEARLAVLEGNK